MLLAGGQLRANTSGRMEVCVLGGGCTSFLLDLIDARRLKEGGGVRVDTSTVGRSSLYGLCIVAATAVMRHVRCENNPPHTEGVARPGAPITATLRGLTLSPSRRLVEQQQGLMRVPRHKHQVSDLQSDFSQHPGGWKCYLSLRAFVTC
jgi:hypothetical protein